MPPLTVPLAFTPNNRNYSLPPSNTCVLCQDYSEIDNFAKSVSLDKLQQHYDSISIPTWKPETLTSSAQSSSSTPDPKFTPNTNTNARTFDATIMVDALVKMNLVEYRNLPGSTLPKVPSPASATANQFREASPLVTLTQWALFPAKYTTSATAMTVAKAENDASASSFPEATRKQKDEVFKQLMDITNASRPAADMIKTIALELWKGLIQLKRAVPGYDQTAVDSVLKARLIYSWIGYSLAFNTSTTSTILQTYKVLFAKAFSTVFHTSRFANASVVRTSFADVFSVMMEALDPSSYAMVETISGYAHPNGGDQEEPVKPNIVSFDDSFVKTSVSGHTWSYVIFADPKLLDVTWAGTMGAVPTWWAQTGNSFSMTHTPSRLALGAKTPEVTDAIITERWNTSQGYFAKEGAPHLQWIDQSTIDVKGVRGVKGKTVTISFKNNCAHQASQAPSFSLGFQETSVARQAAPNNGASPAIPAKDANKAFEQFLKTAFAPSISASMAAGATKDDKRKTTWKGEILVDDVKRGFVAIYQKTGTTNTRVALWDLVTPTFKFIPGVPPGGLNLDEE